MFLNKQKLVGALIVTLCFLLLKNMHSWWDRGITVLNEKWNLWLSHSLLPTNPQGLSLNNFIIFPFSYLLSTHIHICLHPHFYNLLFYYFYCTQTGSYLTVLSIGGLIRWEENHKFKFNILLSFNHFSVNLELWSSLGSVSVYKDRDQTWYCHSLHSFDEQREGFEMSLPGPRPDAVTFLRDDFRQVAFKFCASVS